MTTPGHSGTSPEVLRPPLTLPFGTRAAIFARLLAVQGSWNYEILLGNGIGFCVEPALRRLPGGIDGSSYKEALARESQYFNAHPYLAAVAVGALARAELDRDPPDQITRFRTALSGPLGSVGDRLVWAGWLPFCSLAALAVFGLGGGPGTVLVVFLGLFNVVQFGLRLWGFWIGWRHGRGVATALGNPVFRRGPNEIARLAALCTGIALPLALDRVIGRERALIGEVLVGVVIGAVVIVRLQGRLEGWRLALGLLAAFVLFSVAR